MTVDFDLSDLSDHVITCLMTAVCDGDTWHTRFSQALRRGLTAEEERRSRLRPTAPTVLRIPDDLEADELDLALWSVNSAAADFDDMAREAESIPTTDLLNAADLCRAIGETLATRRMMSLN
jgi:hypothetical protein